MDNHRDVALSAILAMIACSGGQDRDRLLPVASVGIPGQSLPECPDQAYSSCDIRDRDCQARIARLAACVRQSQPLANVRVDLISETAFAELLSQDASGAGEARPEAFYRALSMLGLSAGLVADPSESIGARARMTAGQYRALEKRIIVIDRGVPADTVASNLLLLHESVHALQDSEHDLMAWYATHQADDGTFDRALALASLVEGEAVFYQYRAGVPFYGHDAVDYDYEGLFRGFQEDTLAQLLASSTPYSDSLWMFPYAAGASLAFDAWRKDGPREIDRLWAAPPLTTQQVLAGVRGVDAMREIGIDIEPPELPTGLSLNTHDSLGGWGIAIFLAALGDPIEAAQPQSLTWRGDRLWVFSDSANVTTYALWEVAFDDPADASVFDDAAAHLSGTVDHGRIQARAFISVGSDAPLPSLTAAGRDWLRGE